MTADSERNQGLTPAEVSSNTQALPARPGYGPGRLPPESEGLINWRRYLAGLVRYKWLIFASPFIGTAGGFLISKVIKPEYLTQATIWIENSDEQKGPETGPIRQQQLLRSYSWVELLKSYLVLDLAVQELRLYLQPANRADSALFREMRVHEPLRPGKYRLVLSQAGDSATLLGRGDQAIEHVAVGDSVGRTVGLRWVPPGAALPKDRPVGFTIDAPRIAARKLSQKLGARIEPNGNFLRVDLAGTDQKLVAATVNTVIERYVELAAELKRAKLTELARIMDEQLRQAELSLREAENALESFRVQTITLPSQEATPVSPGLQSTTAPVFSSFHQMRIELDHIRQDQMAIRRALAEATGSTIPIEALSAVGSVQESELMMALKELTTRRADLRGMRYRYTSEHPPLQEMAAAIETIEKRTIPNLAGLLLSELGAREAALDNRIKSASGDLRQIPPRVIQEARLERQVRIADNLFTSLQHRYEEARLAEVSSIPDVRILERAQVPQQPLANTFLYLVLGGLGGGLAIGIALALFLDLGDRRVRYPDHVTAGLGLPILGAVPHLKGGTNGIGIAPLIEAFRGVQLNLTYAFGTAAPLVVTVTSPGAGDGKSFVAANLALAFADAGHLTMLIDGDMRRSSLHRLLATPLHPGLTDVLDGRAPLERVTRTTEFPRLHFVAGGTRMSRAPELLGSDAMTRLLNTLRGKYSAIIVDSPPLGAGTDAYAIGAATGNVLIVVRSGSTNREVAESKLELLDRFPVRVFGAVINDVKHNGVYGSYSYHMAGYEYELESKDGEGRKLLGKPGGTAVLRNRGGSKS